MPLSTAQILRIAAAELAQAHGKELFAEGQHAVQAQLSLRLAGSVEQAPAQLVTPTVAIPLMAVLAMVAERGGIQATRFLELVAAAAAEAMEKGEPVSDYLEHSKAALRMAKERVLASLPKTERAGPLRRIVTVSDIEVSFDTPPAAPVPKRPRRRVPP